MSVKQEVKKWVPQFLLEKRRLYLAAKDLLPLHPRICPICDFRGSFLHFGRPPRVDARCPTCGSLERHRLFWLWFAENQYALAEPVLHFAPEKVFESKFRQHYLDYKTADLFQPADLRLNIENIELPDGAVGTVICNHVLEHVDDRSALGEIFRILKPSGIFVVSVPIVDSWETTYENEAIIDPSLREIHFGQYDHVRYYGRDFSERIRSAGFKSIDEVVAEGSNVVDFGLIRGEKFFICRK